MPKIQEPHWGSASGTHGPRWPTLEGLPPACTPSGSSPGTYLQYCAFSSSLLCQAVLVSLLYFSSYDSYYSACNYAFYY